MFKIVFLNTRSLHKHIPDIANDHNLQCSDVLVICETWAITKEPSSVYDILPGFGMKCRVDAPVTSDSRPHGGMIVYVKPHVSINSHQIVQAGKSMVLSMQITHHHYGDLCLLAAYRHPVQGYKTFDNILSKIPYKDMNTVVLGDFNIDHLIPSTQLTDLHTTMLTRYNASTKLNIETTDYHSSLDHVYTNMDDTTCGVLETYWSDHKAIYVAI